MEKLYTSKTILKMAGGRMHTFHSNPVVREPQGFGEAVAGVRLRSE